MEQKNKIAIVLGSGLLEDGSATPATELRAQAAIRFLTKHPMKLITSGSLPPYDKSTHGLTEAKVMADMVKESGIDVTCLIEDQSFDTLGNAILSARRYLNKETAGTLYVVTSPFHMERSCYIFGKVLGHKWRIRGYKAKEWEQETRQKKAEEALVRTREFFHDITPGDLSGCFHKLLTQIPAYENRLEFD